MSEYTELQKPANEYLKKRGIQFYHIEKGRSVSRSHSAGWADLFIFLPGGRTIFIEFKTKEGVLSKKQCDKRDELLESGYKTHVIRDIQNFIKLIDFLLDK